MGAVLGSMAGGWMLTMGWSLTTVFEAVAIPAVIAAICVLFMPRSSP